MITEKKTQQRSVREAMEDAKAAGIEVVGIEIGRDGVVTLITEKPEEVSEKSEATTAR